MRKGIFMVLVALAIGCKPNYDAPCRLPVTYYQYLDGFELYFWPFTTRDTLIYLTQANDTLRFIPGTIAQSFTSFPYHNNPECPDDSLGYENRTLPFIDSVNLSRTFVTFISKSDALIRFGIDVHTFTWPWEKLDPDSATFDSLQYFGVNYPAVFTQVANGDSLYFNLSKGVVRYSSPAYKMTRHP